MNHRIRIRVESRDRTFSFLDLDWRSEKSDKLLLSSMRFLRKKKEMGDIKKQREKAKETERLFALTISYQYQ